MLTKTNFIEKYPDVREGVTVIGRDGEELGRAVGFDENSFTVQKGRFFPKDFTLRYDDIHEYKDGNIYLTHGTAELDEWKSDSYKGWNEVEAVNLGKVEPSPAEVTQIVDHVELFRRFLVPGLAALVLDLLLSATFLRRGP